MVHLLPTPEESKGSEVEVEVETNRPDDLFERFRVFIQDLGLGTRHLSKRSCLLIQQEV